MLTSEQQQAAIEGKPVELREEDHAFYVLSKEQFEEEKGTQLI